MAGLRRWIGISLAFVLAGRWFQPVAQGLYQAALLGQNIGVGDYVATSGELNALRVAQRLLPAQPACVVFDVGANEGDFARSARAAPAPTTRLLTFEPAPQMFSRPAAARRAIDQVIGSAPRPGRMRSAGAMARGGSAWSTALMPRQ